MVESSSIRDGFNSASKYARSVLVMPLSWMATDWAYARPERNSGCAHTITKQDNIAKLPWRNPLMLARLAQLFELRGSPQKGDRTAAPFERVSKRGYRFELQSRANRGYRGPRTKGRSREGTCHISFSGFDSPARDLLWTCLAEDPGFASGWAYLRRCCAFLDKFSCTSSSGQELARAAFARRSLSIPTIALVTKLHMLITVQLSWG